MTENRKRSVTIRGHRTSFSVEDAFWSCLKQICQHTTNSATGTHYQYVFRLQRPTQVAQQITG